MTAPDAFYHLDSGTLRFWVVQPDGSAVGALIRKEILHYGLRGEVDGGDALALYARHRAGLEDAVRRRVASGSLEPVMLREPDVAGLRVA